MKTIKTEDIQTTLEVLMVVNSDDEMLEKFKEINGLHLTQNAKSSIAECFRFLVALRDKTI